MISKARALPSPAPAGRAAIGAFSLMHGFSTCALFGSVVVHSVAVEPIRYDEGDDQ